MKNQSNTGTTKRKWQSSKLVKTMVYYNLTDRKFQNKFLGETPVSCKENRESEFNDLKNKIHEQNKYFTREIKSSKIK